MNPKYVTVYNLKGGVGTSTLTISLASLMHYSSVSRIAVIDCDNLQYACFRQRERDMDILSRDSNVAKHFEEFRRSGCKLTEPYPIIQSNPSDALLDAQKFHDTADIIFFDLPKGRNMNILSHMDVILIPVTPDEDCLNSTLFLVDMLRIKSKEMKAQVELFANKSPQKNYVDLSVSVYEKRDLDDLASHRILVIPQRILRNKVFEVNYDEGRPTVSTIMKFDSYIMRRTNLCHLAKELSSILKFL